MTFAEARCKHLVALDADYARIRKIAESPDWTNDQYRAYTDAIDKFLSRLRRIRELNAAQLEAAS